MNVFKNFYESVKRGYNQEPNLGPKESLIILIIICIVGVLYLIQKYTNFPALNKTIDFISAILEKLCTFISNL
jgi:hypothetical protein